MCFLKNVVKKCNHARFDICLVYSTLYLSKNIDSDIDPLKLYGNRSGQDTKNKDTYKEDYIFYLKRLGQ